MKRLCIFYYKAHLWRGKPVTWIICKECKKKLLVFVHKSVEQHGGHVLLDLLGC